MNAKHTTHTIIDGKNAVMSLTPIYPDQWPQNPFVEHLIIEDMLELRGTTDGIKPEIAIQSIVEAQQATAARLAEALNSIAPGMTEAIEQIVTAHTGKAAPAGRRPLPPVLEKPDLMKVALAWMFWRTDAEGNMFHVTRLTKFANPKQLQEAILTYPAQGPMNCPRCGQPADLTVKNRFFMHSKYCAEIRCSHCGHVATHERGGQGLTPKDWRKAQVFSCGCAGCRAVLERGRQRLAENVGTIDSRLTAYVRQVVDQIRQQVDLQNSLATCAQLHAADDGGILVELTNPDGDRLLTRHRSWENQLVLDGKRIYVFWWELERIMKLASALGTIIVEPLVNLDDDKAIQRWYRSARGFLDWDVLPEVPDNFDGLRDWIDRLGSSDVTSHNLDIPVAIRVSRRQAAPAKPKPSPVLRARIEAAIDLLRSHGYTVGEPEEEHAPGRRRPWPLNAGAC